MKAIELTRFHVLSFWNWRTLYLGKLIEPLAFFGLLAPGVGGLANTGLNQYMTFVLIGMLGLLTFRAGVGAMVDVANDRKWGVFATYRLSGGSVLGYVASVFLFYAMLVTAQTSALVLVYWAFVGFSVKISLALPVLILMATLFVMGWVALGVMVGIRIESYARRDLVVTVTSLPVILAAPVFYSMEAAPAFLRVLSSLNPLTYQLEQLRSVSGGQGWTDYGSGLSLAFGWAILSLVLAVLVVKGAPLTSRER